MLTLKSFQHAFPNIAAQIVDKGSAPEGKDTLYRTMINPEWWKNAVTPIFNLTKADIKDLGSDLKDGSSKILFLTVNGTGGTREAAIQNTHDISQFIRQAAAYLALESLLRDQQSELMVSQAVIDGKINSTLVELEYYNKRLKDLEFLAKRFPGEARTNAQVVNPNDSAAKYLSISAQIIAANTDINKGMEDLDRLRDSRQRLKILKEWLAQAQPIFTKSYNGLEINDDLIDLEEKLRADASLGNPKLLIFFDSMRNILLVNEARFKFGLPESHTMSAKKIGMTKAIGAGLAGAIFLMLLVLVGQRMLLSIKGESIK